MFAKKNVRKMTIIGDVNGHNSTGKRLDIPEGDLNIESSIDTLYTQGVYDRITSKLEVISEELEVYRAEAKAKEEALAEVERKKEMVRKSKLHLKTLHVHGMFQGTDLLEIKCHQIETDQAGGVTLFIKHRVSGDDIIATIPSKIIEAIVKQ